MCALMLLWLTSTKPLFVLRTFSGLQPGLCHLRLPHSRGRAEAGPGPPTKNRALANQAAS